MNHGESLHDTVSVDPSWTAVDEAMCYYILPFVASICLSWVAGVVSALFDGLMILVGLSPVAHLHSAFLVYAWLVARPAYSLINRSVRGQLMFALGLGLCQAVIIGVVRAWNQWTPGFPLVPPLAAMSLYLVAVLILIKIEDINHNPNLPYEV